MGNGSGVNMASMNNFRDNLARLRMVTLDYSRVAILETRMEFLEAVADMLGSVGSGGGASSVIPSEYVETWAALSKRWVQTKKRNGLYENIGVAHGDVKPGLKAYLMAMARSTVKVNVTGKDASYYWRLSDSQSPGPKTDGVTSNPIPKLHFLEFGVDGGQPARGIWYPVLRWFQAGVGPHREEILVPYRAALIRAIGDVYGS